MSEFKKDLPKGFGAPTKLPQSKEEASEWQSANSSWWESHPMRYDWDEKVGADDFSRNFYEEIDRRFFSNAAEYLEHTEIPFDELVHFDELKNGDVLEIGVGNGSHAALLAQKAKSFTGIDLTDYAVKSTKLRFKIFGIKGEIKKMDAERLEFPDASFDFVWSWGVIHHSSNTEKILNEIHRVLRPGGRAVVMVYHRGWWNYYVTETLYGIISGNLLKTGSLHKSVQVHTDGAIARYYTFSGWRKLAGDLFEVEKIEAFGPKTDILPLPGGKLKAAVSELLPNSLNRFLSHDLKMGSFLVSILNKKS
ncbi:class I SAM-dependent methyltransferase [bacterium]|nr:MAG: class I SAM-dependent methyltransferase [bacterium]